MSRSLRVLALSVVALGIVACADDSPTTPTRNSAQYATALLDEQLQQPGADAEYLRLAMVAPGFGGMFYDASGRLNVYMTQASQRTTSEKDNLLTRVSESLQTFGRPVPAGQDIVIRDAAHDYVELVTLRSRLMPLLGESGVVFTDIDEAQNRLAVGVRGATDAQVLGSVQLAGVPSDAVSIVPADSIVPFSGTLQDWHSPFGGGLQISSEHPAIGYFICSAGFNVWRGAPDRDEKYFFTASHCTVDQGVVTGMQYWSPLPPVFGVPNTYLGVEAEDPPFFACGQITACRYTDAALIRYQPGVPAQVGRIYKPAYFGTGLSSGSLDVSSDDARDNFFVSTEEPWPMVGEVLDKVGRTTGWTRGPVSRSCINLLISVNPRRVLVCQDIINAMSYFGDSGSPVFKPWGPSNNVKLYGIVWGGSLPPRIFIESAIDNLRYEFDGPGCRLIGPGPMVTARCRQDQTFRTH